MACLLASSDVSGAANIVRDEMSAASEQIGANRHVATRKQLVYNERWTKMIRTFASDETERFFRTGTTRRLPPEIRRRAAMRLTQLDAATRVDDLRIPPSNRLEALKADRKGQWSIRINIQWRVCFRFKDGDAFGVEIVDYHRG